MKDLVSIIVPVYNVEEYLAECVDSLIDQTYESIEIILVDDGSKDKSGEICDFYKEKDNRVKVIHKINGGLSEARNVGLKCAVGTYIMFIDSDDFINHNMVQELYKAISDTDSDIAACGFYKFTVLGEIVQDEEELKSTIMSGVHLCKRLYKGENEDIAFIACNKLYKRDLFIKYNVEFTV